MSYYGQHEEDRYAAAMFQYEPHGVFIDVGAYNGVNISNTYGFEKHLAWSGICIEPDATMHAQCKAARPNSMVLHAAAVSDPHTVSAVYRIAGNEASVAGLNPVPQKVKSELRAKGVEWSGFDEIRVPALTLDYAINLCGLDRVDMVSIDTEGTELDVLRGFDVGRWSPRLIILEDNAKSFLPYDDYLSGYARALTIGINAFYVRDTDDAQRLQDAYRAYERSG